MSNALFPCLRGLDWTVTLTPEFKTGIQTAASGREVRLAYRQYPLFNVQLVYEYLRDDERQTKFLDDNQRTEFEQLMGFFMARQGAFDSFLLRLSDLTGKAKHSHVDGQLIGTGDAVTTSFQLVRDWGGASVLIQDPAGTPTVYVAGSLTTAFTVNTTGLITFTSAPASGALITADFDYNLRCRFSDDTTDFDTLAYNYWEAQLVKLRTVKQ